ncbi:MAG: polysaccharide biosynthesis protein [Candidatus Diapherotrites archaeon]|nr:polysaccharide biosynthesis protein [Candidatus Diapherotrites archaeon]
MRNKCKVAVVCSAGGHLREIMQLKKAFEKYEYFFVTDLREDSKILAEKERVLFVECPRRNLFKLLKNFVQALLIYLRERPRIVLSTGADTAIPFCLIAKLFGSKVIFIESFCRIKEPSLSGKIMYRFADVFFVQWKENKKFFPKARFAGSVF